MRKRYLKKVGVQGTLTGTRSYTTSKTRTPVQVWGWDAADGELMNWDQNLGWKWQGRRRFLGLEWTLGGKHSAGGQCPGSLEERDGAFVIEGDDRWWSGYSTDPFRRGDW